MEDHLLQKLHDGLSQANSRRGRQGGLGGVAGQAAAKNTHIVFDEDGTAAKSSGLYANFVKGVTLTSSKEMTCSVTTAASSDDEEGEASPAIAPAKPVLKRPSKANPMETAVPDLQEVGKTEDECMRQTQRKRQKHKHQTTQQEAAEAEPPVSACSELLGNPGLMHLTLQGSRQSLQEHLLSLIPRCRRFFVVGGYGFVDVLIHRDEKGQVVKRKKLRLSHLHGTCDFQNDKESFASLSGIFHFSQGDSERPQVINAIFASDDLFVGGRGICQVFGFPLDKKNKCLANCHSKQI